MTTNLERRATESNKTVRAVFPATFQTRAAADSQPSGFVSGYASVTEVPYAMRDAYGEYEEVIARGAFIKTLSENPNVRFLVNHAGLSHGTTTSGALTLREDEKGLYFEMQLDMRRQDSRDLFYAIESGAVDRMSFMFEVMRQEWSPDWMTRRINEVRMADGDVSAVNFPASPTTNVGARSKVKDLMKARTRALSLRDSVSRSNMEPADIATLMSALALLAEADAAIDPFVTTFTRADEAIDAAQALVSQVAGVDNPNDDNDDETDEGLSVEEALAQL